MEQLIYFLETYDLFFVPGFLLILTIFALITMCKVSGAISRQKKNDKMIKEKAIELVKAMARETAEQENRTEEEKTIKEKTWTKEEEGLLNAVLGEVFS